MSHCWSIVKREAISGTWEATFKNSFPDAGAVLAVFSDNLRKNTQYLKKHHFSYLLQQLLLGHLVHGVLTSGHAW